MEKKRCRHERNSWFYSYVGGGIMWCYKCGAIREFERFNAELTPKTGWMKPVGQDGENPALKDLK